MNGTAKDIITSLFNDAAMGGYYSLIATTSQVVGYFLALHAVYKFSVLADGRQHGEGGMSNVVMTFVIAVCLVSLQGFLDWGRNTLGISQQAGIAYAQFSGWQLDAINSVMNLMKLTGIIFVIRSLFVFRQSTIEVGRGNMPKGFTMLLSGFLLTNPAIILNAFGNALPK